MVFWTRHVAPFLAGRPLHELVAQELGNPFVNLTVTGLGAGALEPGAPKTDAVLRDLPALVQVFKGEPWRILWRFDPLVKGHSSIADFRRIGAAMVDNGITSCTFSFPTYFSLKGNLVAQFDRMGIERWNRAEQEIFLLRLCDSAEELGITLKSCAQPENTRPPLCPLHENGTPRVAEATCIDGALLERGHPDGLPLHLPKDRAQRRHCNCIQSEDIGDYEEHRCEGGCGYCYSKAGGPP